jgi:hypothetical protein
MRSHGPFGSSHRHSPTSPAFEEQWATTATSDRTDLEEIEGSENTPALATILERWRAIERQLDDVEPGSAEAASLFAEFERVRDEYMAAFKARHRAQDG